MLPIWYYLAFSAVFSGLTYSVWRVWSPEIRARLISETEIRKIAENLIAQHGMNPAKAIALTRCQEAVKRNDLFEMAKWDRVISCLSRTINTKD